MKITFDVPDGILAMHIVAITKADWPNIKLINVSVASGQLYDGSEIKIQDKPKEEEQ